MEDRHTISEPRLLIGSSNPNDDVMMLSWEVDIVRDDTVIVDTVILNNETLPPRTNKKGKVVWRLPDTCDKLPSFGVEDRRRILNIFKERKKRRKQEKKKRHDGDGADDEGCENSPGSEHKSMDTFLDGDGKVIETGSNGSINATFSIEDMGGLNDKRKGFQDDRNSHHVFYSSKELRRQSSCPTVFRPPPGLCPSTREESSIGEYSYSLQGSEEQNGVSKSLSANKHSETLPDPSSLHLNPAGHYHSPPQPHLPHINLESCAAPLPYLDALFMIVPRSDLPEPLPGENQPSLAVPAARCFIELYYSHFDISSSDMTIHELARYYTMRAQKSVSIGGAHSVVTGRRDISAQILNLAGAVFVVKGVVAQDAVDGKGVHILITGTVRTGSNVAEGGVLTNFAHSVSLSPVDVTATCSSSSFSRSSTTLEKALEVGFPYQIHNDALALLSVDAPAVPPSLY